MTQEHSKRVLIIDESDPAGTSGIQGDIKTVMAFGGYALTAITSLIAARVHGFSSDGHIEASSISQQIRQVINNTSVDAIKIGFLENEQAVNAVADVLDEIQDNKIPVIVDPSIVSRDHKVLVDLKAVAAWKRRLYVHSRILTPNLEETKLLGGADISDIDEMWQAADMMRTLGVENVVLKCGQIEKGKEFYCVASPHKEELFERERLDTPHTLGAGSALSSALAINTAQGHDIFKAVEQSLEFLHKAIEHSSGFGYKSGPINHSYKI